MTTDGSDLAFASGPRSVSDFAAAVAAALAARSGAPGAEAWPHLETYLDDLAARNGARHVAETRWRLERLRAACPGPTVAEVFAWRSAALRDGRGKTTANHYLGSLKTFLAWAADARLIAPSPVAALKPLAVTTADLRRRPRAFTDEELEQFLAAVVAVDRARGGEPQAPAWAFLAETGLRFGEAVALRGADLRGDVVELPAKRAKRGKGRKVGPLSRELVAAFKGRGPSDALLVARHGKPWSAVGHRVMHRAFVAALERAGIKAVDAAGRSLTIHSLRRTAGTRWLRDGVPIAHVSRLLGHGSTAFTERVYIDLSADDPVDAVRRAREKKEGPGGASASARSAARK